MNPQEIYDLLKEIKYPGFSRDIVSFGIVDDLKIENNNLKLFLKLSSVTESVKDEIINRIKKVVKNYFDDISIEIVGDNKQPPQSIGSELIPNVKNTIAIASGKGGVGKSTVAVNIATGLMLKGFKVGILDLDIYGPSLPILLNINEKPNMTDNNKLVPLKKHNMKIMSFGFLSGNDSPVIWRGPMVARMTEQFFRDVDWGSLDYLILDLPPGTGDIQLTLVQKLKLTGAVIVTTPQDMALSDVRKGADMFGKVNTPLIGVIENMSGLVISGKIMNYNSSLQKNNKLILTQTNQEFEINEDGNFEFEIDLFKKGGGKLESDRLNVPLLGQVPISSELMNASDSGIPINIKNNNSRISNIFNAMVDKIIATN